MHLNYKINSQELIEMQQVVTMQKKGRIAPLYFLRFLPDDLVRVIFEFDGTYHSVFCSYPFVREIKNYYYASPSVRKLHIQMITSLYTKKSSWSNEFYKSGESDFKVDLWYAEHGVVKFKILPKIYHVPCDDWHYFDGFICNYEKTKELEDMVIHNAENGVEQFEEFLYHGIHNIREDVAPLYDMISDERLHKMIRHDNKDARQKWYLWASWES